MDIVDLSVRVGSGKTLLHPTTLRFEAGKLHAVITAPGPN